MSIKTPKKWILRRKIWALRLQMDFCG